jgi:hypothetical protein
LLDPLSSERDAFRFLLYVIAFFALVVGAVLIVRAVF